MKYVFSILYNSGKEESFVREMPGDKAEEMAETINHSFREGVSAVLRLHEDEAVFVNVPQVARVKVNKFQ